MAESHVVSGLVAKRAELAGLIEHYTAEIDRLSGDLGHLDATIKLFNPSMDLRSIRSKVHRERNHYFKPGECSRMVLDVLRLSGTALTSRQLAEVLIERKELASSAALIEQMQKTVLGGLSRLTNKGVVVLGEPVNGARTWRIA